LSVQVDWYRWPNQPVSETENYMEKEKTKVYKFIAHFKHPVIVVRTHKTNRDGDILQDPKYIRFEDNLFTTEDVELADHIRNMPSFGADYYEVDEVPKDKGYQGNDTLISSMNSQQEKEKSLDVKLEAIEAKFNDKIDKLSDLLTKVLDFKPEAKSEVKKDNKSVKVSANFTK